MPPELGKSAACAARVVVADDHPIVRVGVRCLVAETPDLAIVGEAASARDAVRVCRRLRPDLVLVDASPPNMDGILAARQITLECEPIAVLIISAEASPSAILAARDAGALGYVLKSASEHDLLKAMRDALTWRPQAGCRRWIGVDVTHHNRRRILSAREREVVALLALGHTNHSIGTALGISVGTVKEHLARIFKKLGVSDRTLAVVRAMEQGLLPVSANEGTHPSGGNVDG